MAECRVITRIADRDFHRLERYVYLASGKWLPQNESGETNFSSLIAAVEQAAGRRR